MALPAVIRIPDGPAAEVLVGGLQLVNRHIIELYRLGVRDFYLIGNTKNIRTDRFHRVPGDVVLHTAPGQNEHIANKIQSLPIQWEDILLVRGDCLIDPRLSAELLRSIDYLWLRIPVVDLETLPAMARLSRRLLIRWTDSGLTEWLKKGTKSG